MSGIGGILLGLSGLGIHDFEVLGQDSSSTFIVVTGTI